VEGEASHAKLVKSSEVFTTGGSFVFDAVVEGGL
jgi:hypothetical protein